MLTLGVGAAGGLACTTLQMPGGAMSGAVVAVATLSAFGRAAPISKPLQVLALAVMGVAIGSVVGPDTFANIAAYPVSIALMTLCVLMMTAASALAWRAVGWTGAMALLASVPGSMSYIVSASMELGADAAKVAVAQMSRVIFLVTLLPFIATWQAGGRSAAVALPVYDSPGVVALCLVAGLAAGWLLVRMKVTGTVLIGALLASAALHFTGVAPGRAPPSVLIVGQILLGTWVGSRFVGFDWALFARICLGTALAVGSAVAVSIGFAWTASRLFDARRSTPRSSPMRRAGRTR